MAVNGIEIEVGQKWKTRDGEVATVLSHDEPDSSLPWETEDDWLTDTGCSLVGECEHPNDLVELIGYADGFKPWAGGEQPAETGGKTVEYRMAGGGDCEDLADKLRWTKSGSPGSPGDIVAYKVVEEAAPSVEFSGDEPADADALASETLQALGYHFDGQCWVQDAQSAELPKSEPELSGGKLRGDHYYRVQIAEPMSHELQPCVVECGDVIEALDMTFNEGEAFKALWRLSAARQGRGKPGNKAQYDADKVAHYGARVAAHTAARNGKAV